MKISIQKLRYFIIGSLILCPLYFSILDTQIFFVQTTLVILLSVFLIFDNAKVKATISRNSLAINVLIYLGWILISFFLNLFFSMDDLEIQWRRVFSMGTTIILMSGFFVGRNLPGIESNTRGLVKGICFTYLIVMLVILFYFINQPILDLYVARAVIGQRLPFVIGFVSCLAAAYFFFGKPRRIFYFLIMCSGLAAVVFSLTRAAYIQIAISFFILFIKEIRRYFFRVVFIVSLFLFSLIAALDFFGTYNPTRQIVGRVQLLFDVDAQSNLDESGSFRLEMWQFLANKLLDDPARLIGGYGQLGPTQVASEFVSTGGVRGNNAHNQYLDIVVREGLIGLAIFLAIVYKSLKIGFSLKGVSDDVKLFVIANSIGMAGVIFYGFFHETFRYPLFGFYFWLYLGILSRIKDNQARDH